MSRTVPVGRIWQIVVAAVIITLLVSSLLGRTPAEADHQLGGQGDLRLPPPLAEFGQLCVVAHSSSSALVWVR